MEEEMNLVCQDLSVVVVLQRVSEMNTGEREGEGERE